MYKKVKLLTNGTEYKDLETYVDNIVYIMEYYKETLNKDELRESAMRMARIAWSVLNVMERKQYMNVVREFNRVCKAKNLEPLRNYGKTSNFSEETLDFHVILLRLNGVCLDSLDKMNGVFEVKDDTLTLSTPKHNDFLRGIARGNLEAIKVTAKELKVMSL